jgi:hypothetical protein
LIAGGVPAAARLAILILLGVVVYSGIAWWRAADLVSDLKDVMRSRGRNAAVVAEEVA